VVAVGLLVGVGDELGVDEGVVDGAGVEAATDVRATGAAFCGTLAFGCEPAVPCLTDLPAWAGDGCLTVVPCGENACGKIGPTTFGPPKNALNTRAR
jgi:hypothetical protein